MGNITQSVHCEQQPPPARQPAGTSLAEQKPPPEAPQRAPGAGRPGRLPGRAGASGQLTPSRERGGRRVAALDTRDAHGPMRPDACMALSRILAQPVRFDFMVRAVDDLFCSSEGKHGEVSGA
ncbi:unnamed protein product [Prorocentrum cordatum]|uniref:Uncharacterized protein n=1 Tax=Prorocentrum cordatum TaxID=2364126 RepID=A0ABN9VVX8_9DINO|nr:unnamed protein product [Polarella glacialis]